MSEVLNIGWFNTLATKKLDRTEIQKRVSFINAAVELFALDSIGITECQTGVAEALEQTGYATHDYAAVINDRRTGPEGMLVLAPNRTPEELAITRQLSWDGEPIKNRLREDARQLVRYELECNGQKTPHYLRHRFHPHHILHPEFLRTARKQDEHTSRVLQAEPEPYTLQEDSNVALSDAYILGLSPHLTGAYELNHINGPTWRPDHKPVRWAERVLGFTMPPILYLDRAVVHEDIARIATLTTVPNHLGRIANPSDHSMTVLRLAA